MSKGGGQCLAPSLYFVFHEVSTVKETQEVDDDVQLMRSRLRGSANGMTPSAHQAGL